MIISFILTQRKEMMFREVYYEQNAFILLRRQLIKHPKSRQVGLLQQTVVNANSFEVLEVLYLVYISNV